MARISLDLLQQFVTAARLGNLSRAAEQANLTVSALSHQIRQLEQRLERKLFDRGPRGVQLTAEGRRLLRQWATISKASTARWPRTAAAARKR
jgi:LysR family glycine cleavage system transcriptional activator